MTAFTTTLAPPAIPLGASIRNVFESFLDRVADACVDRGIKRLDMADAAWREYVDPRSLDIGSEIHCILGQWDGSYTTGRQALGISIIASRRHGFHASNLIWNDRLNAAWRRRLATA